MISKADSLRWVQDRVSGVIHLRYGFSDHLGSVGGETDHQGKLVTREEYAPFGETTGLDEAATEVEGLIQRTWRYSSKKLDATGLYYYGWRYYQPGLARWLSADPGGLVDGANLYRMNRNNPLRYRDNSGLAPTETFDGAGWFTSREDLTATTPAPIDLDEFALVLRVVGIAIGAFSLVLTNVPYFIRTYEIATENRTRSFSVRLLGSAISRHARTTEGATSIATAFGDGIGLIIELAGWLLMLLGGSAFAAMCTRLTGTFLGWIVRGISGGARIINYIRNPESLRNIPLRAATRFSIPNLDGRPVEEIGMHGPEGNYQSLADTDTPTPCSSTTPPSSSSRRPAASTTPQHTHSVFRARPSTRFLPRDRSPSPVQLRRTRSASPKKSKRLFKG